MSFSVVHAYVIEVLDAHPCQVSEYVHDLNNESEIADDGICHLHHFFHIAYILPEVDVKLSHKTFDAKPYSTITLYEYNSYDDFLKPPIYS